MQNDKTEPIKFTKYKKVKIDYNKEDKEKICADDYISKYTNYKIKNDEDAQQISNLHEDIINIILKEEDDFINEHKQHIDDMVESIKNEMNCVHEVDKPGSDIEMYTVNLDKLLQKEIQNITNLRNRLNKFRIMLKDENALSNLLGDDDEEILLGMEEGFDKNSIDGFDSNEDINDKNDNKGNNNLNFQK